MTLRKRAFAAATTLAVLGSVGLVSTASAATSVPGISPGLTRVNLLNFNDFHGRIDDGLTLTGKLGKDFACTIETAKTTLGDADTVLLSAGDNIGASSFASSIASDEPTLKYLNALELKTSAVGNHEFDRGFSDLTGRVDALADFDYLGANVYQRGTTTPALKEYSIQTVNGVRVGVIGAVTSTTPTLVTPTGVSGLDFGDPVEAVNRVAAQLTDGDAVNGEADVIVAEYHEGAATASSLADAQAATKVFNRIVTETSPKVGVVFNGHTHMLYQWDIAGGTGQRVVSQSGSYGGNLGVVQLGVDPATKKVVEYAKSTIKTAAATPACAADPQYAAAAKIVDEAVAQAKVLGLKPVGKISADITTAFVDAKPVDGRYTGTTRDDRTRDSALGNMVADAWLWAMNQTGRTGAEIGIMNPGGLRGELLYKQSGSEGDGVVTYAEAVGVNPFANTLQTIPVTGAQFKTLLEQQWQPANAPRPYLGLGLSSNVRYTYDPNRPAGDRITGIWYDGERMDPAASYRLAAGNFLIGGGDNFTVLEEAAKAGAPVQDSGQIDTDAFVNYLAQLGTASPSFVKHGVAVLNPSRGGGKVTARIEGIDLTSLGSPTNTSFSVELAGKGVPTITIDTVRVSIPLPVRDGVADVSLKISDLKGMNRYSELTLVAKESGTRVTFPVK